VQYKSGLSVLDFEDVVRVGWGDCDHESVAYTARIPAWAIASIDDWWEAHFDRDGWYQLELDRNVGTPFVNLSMDFRAPITPRHRLRCKVWPTKLGTKSITFRVEGYQSGTLCFESAFTCVFTIADVFESQPAPQDIRAVIEPLLRP